MAQQTADAPAVQERRLGKSYEEYLVWREVEGHLGEWVNGEVIVFELPKWAHQRLRGFVFNLLGLYVRLFRLGEVTMSGFEMRLSTSAHLPDVFFISTATLDRVDEDHLTGTADLVVEIVSDDSVTRDRRYKLAKYEAAGVPECWMLDPRPGRHQTAFYQPTPAGQYEEIKPDAGGRYHSRALPSFWLKPEWFWQDPLPDPAPLIVQIAPREWRAYLVRSGAVGGPEADADDAEASTSPCSPRPGSARRHLAAGQGPRELTCARVDSDRVGTSPQLVALDAQRRRTPAGCVEVAQEHRRRPVRAGAGTLVDDDPFVAGRAEPPDGSFRWPAGRHPNGQRAAPRPDHCLDPDCLR